MKEYTVTCTKPCEHCQGSGVSLLQALNDPALEKITERGRRDGSQCGGR
jgi:hypothetical protein